jgi:crooked neck
MASAPSRRTPGGLTQRDTEVMLPRATRVKNKAPSPIQITAEQILRDARGIHDSSIKPPPRKKQIADLDELSEYRLGERNLFEEKVGRPDCGVSAWVRYARWEEQQGDLARARSVYERALRAAARHRDHALWVKYAEFEMRSRCVGHARNVWDRAVALLPRVDQLWRKYAHMEEQLGAYANARKVFDRWMEWHPGTDAWDAYVKFETRYGEAERTRALYERFVAEHPLPDTFKRYAEFESKHGEAERAHRLHQRAAELLAADGKGPAPAVDAAAIATNKTISPYEDAVRKNPLNYDAWFEYLAQEESAGSKDSIRDVYERAIANVPPAEEKRYWRRYIYLWINYALYEELDAQDMGCAREVYRECLKLIPHSKFTFAKVWVMAAQLEIRRKDLAAARQLLGNAIGVAPRARFSRGTSRWRCVWAMSIGAGYSTRSTSSGLRRAAMPGGSTPSWKGNLERPIVLGRFMSLHLLSRR